MRRGEFYCHTLKTTIVQIAKQRARRLYEPGEKHSTWWLMLLNTTIATTNVGNILTSLSRKKIRNLSSPIALTSGGAAYLLT